MNFLIQLEPGPNEIDDEAGSEFDLESEGSLQELAIVGCSELERAGYIFRVEGFGRGVWPVDVRYDMATVIEQLPDLIKALELGQSTGLDFYAQGIETLIEFVPDGGTVVARCRALYRVDEMPVVEELVYSELLTQLRELARVFVAEVSRLQPSLGQSAALAELKNLAD